MFNWKSLTTLSRLSALAILALAATTTHLPAACIAPDNGFGTANLPVPCDYFSPLDDLRIVDGLPAGTTIEIDGVLGSFFNATEGPGGNLGGHVQNFEGALQIPMVGTGTLLGFNRPGLNMQLQLIETHSAPRMLGAMVQSFDTDMFRLQGQLPPGDPDFDLLRITAGSGFNLPSPGHTTLTQQAGNWAVDSFFDITYRIDFIGAPGSQLAGRSGSTTGTIRMATMGVPEPSTLVLAAIGGLGLVALLRRRADGRPHATR